MEFQVRPYRSDDFETIVPMAINMHEVEGVSHLTSEQFGLTVNEFQTHPDKGEILVIEYEKIVLGFMILVYFWSNDWSGDIVYLDELYVAAPFRNQGIGKRCLEYLRDRFVGKSAGIMLETTPEKGRAASLYKRFGFIPAENNFWQYMFREIVYPK